MTVLIVVTMFVLILLVDYLVSKRNQPAVAEKPTKAWTPPRLEPVVVGGIAFAILMPLLQLNEMIQ